MTIEIIRFKHPSVSLDTALTLLIQQQNYESYTCSPGGVYQLSFTLPRREVASLHTFRPSKTGSTIGELDIQQRLLRQLNLGMVIVDPNTNRVELTQRQRIVLDQRNPTLIVGTDISLVKKRKINMNVRAAILYYPDSIEG